MHCACVSQITATSSKVTTISNWKTTAWRLSSWVKSQRTGSAVEHFQNLSQLAKSWNDNWPHEDIALVSHTTCGHRSAQCCVSSYLGNSAHFCVRHVPSSLYNQPPVCRKAPRDLIPRLNKGYWIIAMLLCDSFVMLMQIYYNMYPLFYCFIDFVVVF